MFILAIAAAGTFLQGAEFPLWTFINDNYIALLTTNILISYALATYVYIASFSVKPNDPDHRELAAGGTTGNIIYDWFIGRELNPRIRIPLFGEVDIKSFMELRPGMLGWILLDLAFAARQYATYGYITDSMCKSLSISYAKMRSDRGRHCRCNPIFLRSRRSLERARHSDHHGHHH